MLTTARILGQVLDSLRGGLNPQELRLYLDLLQAEGVALEAVRDGLWIQQYEQQMR